MNATYKRISEFLGRVELAPSTEPIQGYYYHRFTNKTNRYTSEYALRFQGSSEDWREELAFLIKHLGSLRHSEDPQTVASFIALLALSQKKSRDESFVKKTFQMVKKISIKQYHFFPRMVPGFVADFSFSSFRFGLIDFQKFKTFVKNHSSSDFVDTYAKHLENKVGLEVKTQDIFILDVFEFMTQHNIPVNPIPAAVDEIVSSYLTCIGVVQTARTKKIFDEHQQMISAMFGVHYDIFELEKFGIFPVSIFFGFKNSKSNGWVLPLQSDIIELDMADPRIVGLSNAFIQSKEHLLFSKKGHYSRFLGIVTEYFAIASRNIHKDQFNHAFMDYFVGLDFLLAPDTEKSKKLKARIALLTFEKFKNSFPKQISLMDTLYDARSNYIHNGISIAEKDLIDLMNIAKTILGCVLNMHERNLTTLKVSYDDWLKKIDFLIERIYMKGEQPVMKDRIKIGTANLEFVLLNNSLDKYDDEHLNSTSAEKENLT